MRKLYDKDLRRFFESARFRVSGSKSPGGGLLVAGSTTELAGKNKAKQVKYDSYSTTQENCYHINAWSMRTIIEGFFLRVQQANSSTY